MKMGYFGINCVCIIPLAFFSIESNAQTASTVPSVYVDQNHSMAIGSGATVPVLVSNSSNNAPTGQTAVGAYANATGQSSLAVGNSATAVSVYDIAIGPAARADGSPTGMVNGVTWVPLFPGSATAIGVLARAEGATSIAIGPSATTTAGTDASIAIGTYAMSTGVKAISIGEWSNNPGRTCATPPDGACTYVNPYGNVPYTAGNFSAAVGVFSASTGNQAAAFGPTSYAGGAQSAAFGSNSSARGEQSIAIGYQATANENGGISIGNGSVSNAIGGVAIGPLTQVSQSNGTAVGQTAQAGAANTTAIGAFASTLSTGSVALGSHATASANDGDVAIGQGSTTQAVVATPGMAMNGTYYTFAGAAPTATVSVGSADTAAPVARTVTNVAAGQLSANSTDAINGSQLFAVVQAFSSYAGAGAMSPAELVNSPAFSGVPGGATIMSNVAPGVAPTDAVNLEQAQGLANGALASANFYTDKQISNIRFNLAQVDKRLKSAAAGANALSGLPQAFLPGQSVVSTAAGQHGDAVAFAVGLSRISRKGRMIVKASGSYEVKTRTVNSHVGVGYAF